MEAASLRTCCFKRVDAAICYYGGGIDGCLQLADKISQPIMFHYAMQMAILRKIACAKSKKAAFTQHNKAIFHDYAATDHGFNCWAVLPLSTSKPPPGSRSQLGCFIPTSLENSNLYLGALVLRSGCFIKHPHDYLHSKPALKGFFERL